METSARELIDEKKTKEIKLIENNLQIDLNVEKQHRREAEAKLTKLLDERLLYTLRLDLAKEKKVREEAQEGTQGMFGEQMRRLQERMEEHVGEAEEEN